MRRTAIGAAALLAALGLAAYPAAAESSPTDRQPGSGAETSAPDEKGPKLSPFVFAMGGKPSVSDGNVYSNADLERMFGPPPPPEPVETPARTAEGAGPGDANDAGESTSALDLLFERRDAARERDKALAEAEQQVADARKRVTELERRVLATKNPFLARPGPPEEGAEEWRQAGTPQRLQMAEQELQAAREAVTEAERKLAELRRSNP
jgi:hypothetical protein